MVETETRKEKKPENKIRLFLGAASFGKEGAQTGTATSSPENRN